MMAEDRKKSEVREPNRCAILRTALGDFTALFTEHGLVGLRFPGEEFLDPSVPAPAQSDWVGLTKNALDSALAGEPCAQLPPLDWRRHTEFRCRVWTALLGIPFGETRSYGEIAAAIGSPAATRAVGAACGANPIPVLVPCHRVLAAGGALGGFSGGLEWKRRLLAIESPGILNLASPA